MSSYFNNLSFVQYDNLISILYRAQAVGDNDNCFPHIELIKIFDNHAFIIGV